MEGVVPLVTGLSKEKAKELWKSHCEAIRKTPTKHLKTMKKAYRAISAGETIIDIYDAFQKAGKHDNDRPKLAIARAHLSRIWFQARDNGAGSFWSSREHFRNFSGVNNASVRLPEGIFGSWSTDKWERWAWNRVASTAVPPVPAEHMPKSKLNNYFILWEVEPFGWADEPIPPGDPMLLKRLSPNLFVVLAVWDLSPLERAVLRGAIT